MGIDVKQLRDCIIIPTLKKYSLYSNAAVNLLLGTCAQESQMGTYVKQITGPALGIYQMEPATHDDIWKNTLPSNILLHTVLKVDFEPVLAQNMIGNLVYATIMARLLYLRVKEPLPESTNVNGLAAYWKRYYNTPMGKGTVNEFVSNYNKYVKL